MRDDDVEWELIVRGELDHLLDDADSAIVVDSIRTLSAEEDRVLMVNYHLEGKWESPAAFSFPFLESVPLEESAAALRDFIERNWATAHLPPVQSFGRGQAMSSGAD